MDRSRWVSVVVVLGLAVSACGGGTTATTPSGDSVRGSSQSTVVTTSPTSKSIENGLVTDAGLAGLVKGDDVDRTAAENLAAAVLALPADERLAAFADLSTRLEREASKVSGLEGAVGSEQATDAALRGAWAQINGQISALATLPPLEPTTPGKSAHARRAPVVRADDGGSGTAAGTGAVGVFMGALGLGLTADAVVSSANDFSADQYSERTSAGSTITGAVEQSSVELEFKGTQDGVDIDFKAQAVVHPCPKADGTFDIQLKLDVKTAKNGAGTNATIDVDIKGTVDDNAELVGYDSVNRTQWADFAGGKGQFLDMTIGSSGGKLTSFTTNRTGGTVTKSMTMIASLMALMFESLIAERYVEAAKKAWQSGRCVDLKLSAAPGPKGMKPSSTAKVLAEPRSKVDGAAVGGTVTATLSSGGADVAPSATKVAADATFTYTAPSEKNKNGTIAAESRSKRGVGKRSITLDTAVPAAFHIVGGLDDFQADQDVCDVLAPFTLTGGGFTLSFSGGLTGTYTYTGPFAAQGNGTYEIRLADDPTKPGTMVGGGEGSVDTPDGRFSNAGTERYTLTPIDPC